jgi:hypothetical protein
MERSARWPGIVIRPNCLGRRIDVWRRLNQGIRRIKVVLTGDPDKRK